MLLIPVKFICFTSNGNGVVSNTMAIQQIEKLNRGFGGSDSQPGDSGPFGEIPLQQGYGTDTRGPHPLRVDTRLRFKLESLENIPHEAFYSQAEANENLIKETYATFTDLYM